MNEIIINGIEYIKKQSENDEIYVIVRTESAGCFAGYMYKTDKNGNEVILRNARRLWYWDGASSLSQLAMEGVKHPENCKFPCEVQKITLLGVIEIINATEESRKCISAVPIWRQ